MVNLQKNWVVAYTNSGPRWLDGSTYEPLDVPFAGMPTFSPDGTWMAVDNVIVNLETGSGRRVDLSADLEQLRFSPGQTVFSPDNRLIAARFGCAGCREDARTSGIALIDTETRQWRATIPVPEELPPYEGRRPRIDQQAFAFSPDSRTLQIAFGSVNSPHTQSVSANLDLGYWDVQAVIEQAETEPRAWQNLHDSTPHLVRELTFGLNGQFLVAETSAVSGGSARVWFYDAASGESQFTFGDDGIGPAFRLVDQRAYVFALRDDALQFFDVANGELALKLPGFFEQTERANLDHWQARHPAAQAALDQWQTLLAAQPDTPVAVDRIAPWMALSPDGSAIAILSGGANRVSVQVQDRQTGAEIARFDAGLRLDDFTHLAFSRDSRFVIIDNCDRTYSSEAPLYAEIWDWQRGERVASLENDRLCLPLYVDDLSAIETISEDGRVQPWQPQATALAQTLHGDWSIFAYSLPGDVLAAGSLEGRLSLWDVTTGKKLVEWSASSEEIAWLAFNEDGTLLMTSRPHGVGMILWGVPGDAVIQSGGVQNPVPYIPPTDQIVPRSYQGIG